MTLIFFTILLIILFGASVFMLVCMVDNFWRTIIIQHAPFVPIPQCVVPHIVHALAIQEGSTVYDLGCGDSRVLAACYRHQPHAVYKGLDTALLPRILSWIRLKRIKKPHTISIRNKNFFHEDISDATHIFIYLFPKVMDDLLPKFQKECKKGTRIVSCDFQFQHKEPIKIIDLQRSKNVLGKYLYMYEI
jgi:hypothetical protein